MTPEEKEFVSTLPKSQRKDYEHARNMGKAHAEALIYARACAAVQKNGAGRALKLSVMSIISNGDFNAEEAWEGVAAAIWAEGFVEGCLLKEEADK